jgi:hypothetical protein
MPRGEAGVGKGAALRPPDRRRTPWANAGLVFASVLSSLLAIEVGARLAAELPLLEPANWRASNVVRSEYKAIVDPVLGWTLKPWMDVDDYSTSSFGTRYSTIDHGIRPNFGEKTVRTGGILAV